jgi:HAD superfamily phosphoserine phosphatase-like hydrolase
VEAAFFDLDKTVIAKASMVAFSGPLHRAGLLNRRMLLRAAWGQLIFAQFGASDAKVERLRDSVLRLTRGWGRAEVSRIVEDALVAVIEPIVYEEALELIRAHRAAGRRVFIVSASPEEVVHPLGRYLGVDESIGTRAEADEEAPSPRRRNATASTWPPRTRTATRPATGRCWRSSATRWPSTPTVSSYGRPAVTDGRCAALPARFPCGSGCPCRRLETRQSEAVPPPSRSGRASSPGGGWTKDDPRRLPPEGMRRGPCRVSDASYLLRSDGSEGGHDDEQENLLHGREP